jgi:RimJ/RimL family protein N-acetyltransferase
MSKSEAKKLLDGYTKKYQSRYNDGFFIDIDGDCVGAISLGGIEKNHQAKVGYWLGKEYRGKGIMTAALKMITEYGFKKYRLKRIIAYVVTFNKPSARLLEKCGYKLEGVLKKHRLKNGKYYDDYLYALTR